MTIFLKFTRRKRIFESILELDDSMRDKLTVNARVYHDKMGTEDGQRRIVGATICGGGTVIQWSRAGLGGVVCTRKDLLDMSHSFEMQEMRAMLGALCHARGDKGVPQCRAQDSGHAWRCQHCGAHWPCESRNGCEGTRRLTHTSSASCRGSQIKIGPIKFKAFARYLSRGKTRNKRKRLREKQTTAEQDVEQYC